MNRRHLKARALLMLTGAALLAGCDLLAAPTPAGTMTVVASGFNGPQGVLALNDGSVLVSEDGLGGSTSFTAPGLDGKPAPASFGPSARLVKVMPDGTQSVLASLLSVDPPGVGPTGGGKIARIGSDLYVDDGIWNAGYSVARPDRAASVLKVSGGVATELSNLYAFEVANNPDGVPAAQGGIDSHPYGLTAGPDGRLYVADAGANALLKVDPATGAVSLVAKLSGLTGTKEQAVPTGVTFGKDGNAYVSLLSGFPFPAGASRVVRVVNGVASDFAAGMTMLTSVVRGPDDLLYVTSFAAVDITQPNPYLPGTGQLIRLKADGSKEVLKTALNYPTAIDFNAQGDAYVTVAGYNRGAVGSGQLVRYAKLTQFRP